MTADPYPTNLIDEEEIAPEPDYQRQILVALNRIAIALERGSQPVQNAPGRLAALPPIQTAGQRPVCPLHGPDKVAASTNGKGGFYCQAKAGPGQPANPKGYCTWHS